MWLYQGPIQICKTKFVINVIYILYCLKLGKKCLKGNMVFLHHTTSLFHIFRLGMIVNSAMKLYDAQICIL